MTAGARLGAAALAAWVTVAAAGAHAAAPGPCDASWRIVPRLDAAPRSLEVEVSFDATLRTSTELRITREWGGVRDFAADLRDWRAAAPHQRIEPASGPAAIRVVHRAGERVTVRYRVASRVADPEATPFPDHRDSYRALLGRDWFQFFGHAVLAVPEPLESRPAARLCLAVDGAPDGAIVTSHGTARGAGWHAVIDGPAERVRHAVYLGGRIDVAERALPGGRLVVARRGAWPQPVDALADATARVVVAHRAFWSDHAFPYLAVTLVPNGHPDGSYGGTAIENAFAMNAAADFRAPGSAFDFLVGHEHLHTWIPARIGAMGDESLEAQHYWFSEGFTDYYAHRLLVRSGIWTLDQYADALNGKIARYLASPERNAPNERVRDHHAESSALGDLPYQRGELVALRIDAMLRERGRDLDAVMRSLALSREAADRLAVERAADPDVLAVRRFAAALAPLLGDAGAREIERSIERGMPFELDADLLGPCFGMTVATRPRWTLGFDPRSLSTRVAEGVDPSGPAYAAGLRDGDRIDGYSIRRDDVAHPARVEVRDAAGAARVVSYLPVASAPIAVPVYRPDDRARTSDACRRWAQGAPGDAARGAS